MMAFIAVSPVLVVSLIVNMCFFIGIHDYLTNFEENGCKMTYMYEYPQYVRIGLPDSIRVKFPRYNLFVYGEGQYTERLRNMQFSGIPVLFIPGSAGSHKQVRSLASVSLRTSLDKHTKYHFNYFTVDFNEELSALFGGVLEEQTMFVQMCIHRILQLYPDDGKHRPLSVILVGHSMGGVVAKALFTRPRFDPNLVHSIITLATPHDPVINIDSLVSNFYRKVNGFWLQKHNSTLSHVVLVSVGGGFRDVQVRPGLTTAAEAAVNVVSTAVPTVWVSTDHCCIVWCKQLVLTLNRMIFGIIDVSTKQPSRDVALRKNIFQYHLCQANAGKYYSSSAHLPTVKFDQEGRWTEVLKRQWTYTVSEEEKTRNTYLMVRLVSNPKHEHLTLETVGLEQNDWVFACLALKLYKNVRMCETGDNLSDQAQLLPSQHSKRKMVHLDLVELQRRKYTHVVVHVAPTDSHISVNIDVYTAVDRRLPYSVPSWITFPHLFSVIDTTVSGAVFYNISLLGLDTPWKAYSLKVQSQKCTGISHHGVARMVTPWNNDVVHAFLGQKDATTLSLKLQKPKKPGLGENVTAQVHLILDPKCTYSVRIKASFVEIWGQMVRFYGIHVTSVIIALVIIVLRKQLQELGSDSSCSPFHVVMVKQITPLQLVLPCKLLSLLLTYLYVSPVLPKPDFQLMSESGLDFGILPILIFFVAYAILYIMVLIAWVIVALFGKVAHKATVRFLSQTMNASTFVGELAVEGLSRFPDAVSAFLVALGYATCGTLALAVGLFIYFIKLCRMYHSYLEGLFLQQDQNGPKMIICRLHFHFTLSVLWLWTTVLHIPCLIVWGKNIKFDSQLPSDPSFPTAVVLGLCASALWQDSVPKPRLTRLRSVSCVLQVLSFATLLYGFVSMYRISYIICMVFIVITLHQMFGTDAEPAQTTVPAESQSETLHSSSSDSNESSEGSLQDAPELTESSEEASGEVLDSLESLRET